MSLITLPKNSLGVLVQHLRDAQSLLRDQYQRSGDRPDPYDLDRQRCIDFYVKTFFKNTPYPLCIYMNDDNKNPIVRSIQGLDPIWPGDEPKAPAPGTVTVDPETGETIIVPIVQ